MKAIIWISYDLGIKGDYETLYIWLDSHGARECGDSVAYLSYEYEKDIVSEIKTDLRSKIKIGEKDRIYLIYKKPKTQSWIGMFIFGGRKPAPWEGFSAKYENGVVDE